MVFLARAEGILILGQGSKAMDDESWECVSMGICQIEDLIRAEHIGTAEIAFELTASGLAPLTAAAQTARLRQLARALGANASFLDEHPLAEVEVAQASRFGPH